MGATALRTNGGLLLRYDGFATISTVPRRNTMSPPKLTRNTPVLDILHPVIINLIKSFGDKLYLAVANCFNSRLCEGFHFNKPLL